jgi:flagellar biosynthesis/type III secretory pathway protein FliH
MTQNHIYPSQEEYDGKNPVVSFRLTNEDKKKLEEMASREGMTLGQYVRDYLKGIVEKRETEAKIRKDGRKEGFDDGRKDGFDKGRNEGLKEGYENGKEDWAIWFECCKCGKRLYIEPQSDLHEAIIGYLKDCKFAHKFCPKGKIMIDQLIPELSKLFLAAGQTTSSKPDEKNE